jgi:RNA polymerase sigma factor (sigma-70 family)
VLTTMVETRDDRALVADALEEPEGDAFHALYQRHATEVWRFVRRLVGDATLAEDVLQETFFRVYQHLSRYESDRPFRPWLFRIARNAALNALRARRKLQLSEKACEGVDSGRVPAQAAAREAAAEARLALQGLPDEQQALLLQRHLLGMTQVELAESWGCTERTIRNRLEVATQALTQTLLAAREGGAE